MAHMGQCQETWLANRLRVTKKDIRVGTVGKVVGFADCTGDRVILEVTVNVAGKRQTISNTVTSRNMCSTSEYSLEHVEQPEEASGNTGPADKPVKQA